MNLKNKILYVDDEHINLKLFEINFGKNYDIITTDNGLEALEILKKNSDINIVISDMKMPIMNGLEFISKAKVLFPDISFYILTGFDITEEISKALESKMILKYFRKPLDRNEINLSLKELTR